jgi:hypothetical protein
MKDSTQLQELFNEYKVLLIRMGRIEGLINTYEKLELENDFDLEGNEIQEWYEEDKEELPELRLKVVELENKLEMIYGMTQ